MKDDCVWLNFRWGLDIAYTNHSEAPLLLELCKKYGRFWDGEFYYQLQSSVVLRWPDWRKKYRINMEKVRIRTMQSKQTRLELEAKQV
jgi:hypothetical protein